ncbi:MAG: DHH family phosphoesterase [Thermofilum sp.]
MTAMNILRYLSGLPSAEEILIVTHVNADPDAVATALVVKSVLEGRGFRAKTCFPEGPSKLSKELLAKLEVAYRNDCSCAARRVIVCDTSNESMLAGAAECLKSAEIVIIDHHEPGSLIHRASTAVVDAKEVAATVIAVELAKLAGVGLEPKLATLALAGILYDSKRFSLVTPRALRAAAWLLESGGSYEAALLHPEEELEYSERIARLKAAQRAMIIDICGTVVALTEVSAYEASAARALVALGADLAFVLGGKGELRVSARASERVLDAGLSIAEIAKRVAASLGGEGGGHKGAGGVKIRNEKSRSEVLRALASEVVGELMALCREER